MIQQLLANRVLMPSLLSWWLAQFLKVPIDYILSKKWNWGFWFSSGGMPSSHSSLVVSSMVSIGLNYGFDSPLFGLATALAMIVVYDAAGVRRQAGIQAQKINQLIEELLSGHPISEEQLKEVLGHTPSQVIAGSLLGLVISISYWWITS